MSSREEILTSSSVFKSSEKIDMSMRILFFKLKIYLQLLRVGLEAAALSEGKIILKINIKKMKKSMNKLKMSAVFF